MAQTVKRLPTMQETRVQSLGQEDLLEKEMATHSSIPAWRIPPMEELVATTVHGVAKSRTRLSDFPFPFRESDTTEQLTPQNFNLICNVERPFWLL